MNEKEKNKEIPDIGIRLEIEDKIDKKEIVGQGVVDDKNIFATYPHLCTKCGHDKAQVIEMGIWYSDEAGVIRFRCGKCGFTEQTKESNS